MESNEWKIGKWHYKGIGLNDYGGLSIFGHFEYEDGCQSFGFMIDDLFIYGILKVFGVDTLEKTNGKIIKVLCDNSNIYAIQSFAFDGKKSFDFQKWIAFLKTQESTTVAKIESILKTLEV